MSMHALSIWKATIEGNASKASTRLRQAPDAEAARRGKLPPVHWLVKLLLGNVVSYNAVKVIFPGQGVRMFVSMRA